MRTEPLVAKLEPKYKSGLTVPGSFSQDQSFFSQNLIRRDFLAAISDLVVGCSRYV